MADLTNDPHLRVVRRSDDKRPAPPSFREMAEFAELSRARLARLARPSRERTRGWKLLANFSR